MVSIVPDNPLGRAASGELRRHGVDAGGVRAGSGRMGLYFLTPGAGLRAAEVLYDRAGSAFAEAAPDLIDWSIELKGADHFHISGVTAAVGPKAAEAAVRAARAARAAGLTVSMDCNYRARLWQAWDGDGPAILSQIMDCADLVFGDHRDIALVLGVDTAREGPLERRRAAAEAAFAAFPKLSRMASTDRRVHTADHHELTGYLLARDEEFMTEPRALTGIVDRIGGGDAFAAGLIHGLRRGWGGQRALEFALAAGLIKHMIAGDFCPVSEAEIEAVMAGDGADVRR
jgi:2-dehydro-3-deoxygluconokinase